MATVLLEIGTEEVPATYLPPALAQLADLARARLDAERITFEDLQTWGTPRRIVLFVTGVAPHQAPRVHEVRGPAVSAAFAATGEPTQAAIGFARSQGVPVSDLRIKTFDGSEYVVAVFHDEGRPTLDLLPEILPALITGLTFPKTMRWGTGPLRFARPIRWIVALMDDQVAPFTLGEVTAGRVTSGHRFLAPGEAEIPAASDYRRIMNEDHVLVVPDERREEIRSQLEGIAQQDGAMLLDGDALLDETTFMVEYPSALRGAIDARFLELPEEVLRQVLRYEQRYFMLASPEGALLPAFIVVRNGDKAYLGTVREGYEAVARAKLIDALFFFEQDRQRTLTDRLEQLREVVFLERLGTLHEKSERMQALANAIAVRLSLPLEERILAERAALLAKADLVTAMVTEHPELQGAMGRIYARLSGESEAVARAIGEQYLPRAAGDPLPGSPLGRIVALADKLDTIVACFAVGLVPTGSEDPYALRRDAYGVVRILTDADYRLPLSWLLAQALGNLHFAETQPVEETQAALESFFRQRVETLLIAEGIPLPTARAVMAVSADLPADALTRARVLLEHADDSLLAEVVRVGTRLANITKHFSEEAWHLDLLTEPAERDLLARYQETAPEAERLAAHGEFEVLFRLLATLTPAVDRFFAEVLVMADDPDLRQARLTLVWRLAKLFRLLADLTVMGG